MIDQLITENKIVWNRWYRNAEKYPNKEAIIHFVAGEEPYRWTFSSIISAAQKFSFLLNKNGIKQGEVCALIIRHNPNFYPLYMAISHLGAIPAVLAYPNPRLHPDKFRQGIEGMSLRSGLDWILTEKEIDSIIRPIIEKRGSTIKGIHYPLEWGKQDARQGNQYIEDSSQQKLAKPNQLDLYLQEIEELHRTFKNIDPFLLQHSSGTTGLQKPVLLSHKAVLKHVENYAEAVCLNEDDKVVSWLPLYHDMGLIAAFHLPLAIGIPSVQIDPFEWVIVPSLLLEAITKEKCTITWLPNFAYNLMADKIHDDELENVSLENMRLFINCSEPIRQQSHEKFYNRFKKYGLKQRVLSTCYAMAETTFAVTQTPPDTEPDILLVDRLQMSKGKIKLNNNYEFSRVCVSSGRTIKGCEIKIVDENRKETNPNMIGEMAIKSVSMFDGYRNYPKKTTEILVDGWYYSGDYGFKYNDDYYIIGRKKDIIIVAGNNIYPEDIEDAVGKVEGVIPGRVVAFGEEDVEIGSEQISVIAETGFSDINEQKKLKTSIVKAGMDIDVTIKNIYLVPARWLIKSSAGKPSRKANRERILNKDEINWS
jgi:acyl-CoA synthetase (AMP-forming)/AMP-acid ligase II